MTIAKLLELLGFSANALADFLRAIAVKFPEGAAAIEEWISKLNAPLTGENLVAVFKVLPGELLNIVQGKLDPHEHPSDGA